MIDATFPAKIAVIVNVTDLVPLPFVPNEAPDNCAIRVKRNYTATNLLMQLIGGDFIVFSKQNWSSAIKNV